MRSDSDSDISSDDDGRHSEHDTLIETFHYVNTHRNKGSPTPYFPQIAKRVMLYTLHQYFNFSQFLKVSREIGPPDQLGRLLPYASWAFQFERYGEKNNKTKINYFDTVEDSLSTEPADSPRLYTTLDNFCLDFAQLVTEKQISLQDINIIPIAQVKGNRNHFNTLLIHGDAAGKLLYVYLIEPRSTDATLKKGFAPGYYPIKDISDYLKNQLPLLLKDAPELNVEILRLGLQWQFDIWRCVAYHISCEQKIMFLPTTILQDKTTLEAALSTVSLSHLENDKAKEEYVRRITGTQTYEQDTQSQSNAAECLQQFFQVAKAEQLTKIIRALLTLAEVFDFSTTGEQSQVKQPLQKTLAALLTVPDSPKPDLKADEEMLNSFDNLFARISKYSRDYVEEKLAEPWFAQYRATEFNWQKRLYLAHCLLFQIWHTADKNQQHVEELARTLICSLDCIVELQASRNETPENLEKIFRSKLERWSTYLYEDSKQYRCTHLLQEELLLHVGNDLTAEVEAVFSHFFLVLPIQTISIEAFGGSGFFSLDLPPTSDSSSPIFAP